MKFRIDRTGIIYGRLTALYPDEHSQGKWVCQCLCGNIKSVCSKSLGSGNTQSCGCLVVGPIKHGMASSLTYNSWRGMIERCSTPGRKDSKSYNEKGICVCQEWLTFEGFLKDMGHRPGKDFELDRRDNNKGYDKKNCRWIPHKINSQNTKTSKRWNIDGTEYNSLVDASKELNVAPMTIKRWCDGYFKNGVFVEPKINCYSTKAINGDIKL